MAIKKYRGGKYSFTRRGQGYFGNNDAGNPQYMGSATAGVKREFIGSNTKEYTFYEKEHGTHTITAESYEEALRIAESMGYTASDYKKRRRGR